MQTYNNPLVRFKSESYIVLMTIAWTYLMHAYYSREGVEFRYRDNDPKSKRRFQRSPQGGHRHWELSTCIKVAECPLDLGAVNNLSFLIGLRNEIEHHRPPHLDDHMSGRYLACALNYEHWLVELFGERLSLGDTMAMALHFRDIKPADTTTVTKLPSRLASYIERFEGGMTQEEFDDPRFAVRLMFTRKVVNKKGQADRAIEFVKPGDPGAEGLGVERVMIKDVERPKHRATAVYKTVQAAGYPAFGNRQHTQLWQRLDAKDSAKGYGVFVEGTWYWYDNWIVECLTQCRAQEERTAVVSPRRHG